MGPKRITITDKSKNIPMIKRKRINKSRITCLLDEIIIMKSIILGVIPITENIHAIMVEHPIMSIITDDFTAETTIVL